MSHFDVIVIGLGAAGAATTYQSAKRGSRVLGIDRFDPPHDRGSTHGDSRITRLAIGEGSQYAPLAIRSHEIWREIEEETGATLLTQCGALYIGPLRDDSAVHGRAGFLTRTRESAERYGIPIESLEVDEVRTRFPAFNVQPNERALFEPTGGFVRPEECVRQQLALAVRHGARIHTHEQFLRYDIDAQGLVSVQTNKGMYTADRLVLSMGAWIGHAVPASVAAHFKVLRQLLCWFAIDGDPREFDVERCPVHIWAFEGDRGIYGFPAIDGVHGGVKIAMEQYVETTTADTIDRTVTEVETSTLHAELVARAFPGVSSRVVRTATCLYTVTPGFDFIIDTLPEQEQVMVVSPCSGHGFKHSAAIGEGVAEWGANGRLPVELAGFAGAWRT